MKPYIYMLFGLSGIWAAPVQSQDLAEDTIPRILEMPQITVVQERDGLFGRTPGSVSYVSSVRIRRLAPLSGNEVFKVVPGVHVMDEEGAGLRLNLGIRGLDPDRSRGVLVLEDGLPVALAPYGEPEMYYTPAMERMSAIEVVKGNGQIMFGPQTIGGVVNYITADPPAQPEGFVRLQGGQGGLFQAQAGYGATLGHVGYHFHYLHKQADRIAYVGYRIEDLTGKIRFRLSRASSLGLKFSLYDEWSDATYLGLTQTMFERGGEDFVPMAPDDQLNIRRYAGSLTHSWKAGTATEWKTALFGYTTTRNWQRQDFSSSAQSSPKTGVIWGDTLIAGGAIYMLDKVSHRNRQFEVGGLDSRLSHQHRLFGPEQQLDLGIRFLFERAFEQRVNGTRSDAASGNLVEDEERTGRAVSAHVQNRLSLGRSLTFTAGLRGEWFDYDREIFRGTFSGSVRDTFVRAGHHILTAIPGAGINWSPLPGWTVFAGVHRGFAPPRVKDAITQAGEALDLEAELSWNSEIGLRKAPESFLGWELTGFLLDFSNQIIPVSQSSGGSGTGLVNGGETRHWGLEAQLDLRLGQWLGRSHQLDLVTSTTLTHATFSSDRFVSSGNEMINIKGNRTPYAPTYLQSATLSYLWSGLFGVNLHALFTSEQFGDELNITTPSPDGRIGRIDGFRVLDVNAFYQVQRIPIRIGFSVKNVTDERYIVTRRPQGIRLGLPRYFSGSLEYRF